MMREVEPKVFLISRPAIDWYGVIQYLTEVGGLPWFDRVRQNVNQEDGQTLIEFMGRMCYRSWAPELNPNVTKVREDSFGYLTNILDSGHGSVLEHATYGFVFHNVSRVFTHELVRHRAGIAVSQESMRYVRLNDIPFQHPDFVQKDPELLARANELLAQAESFMELAVDRTGIAQEGVSFHEKKTITSAMRRYAPDGVATSIGWTANIRAIRHVLELRTAPGAEVEIRKVFDEVGHIMTNEVPALFSDFVRTADGAWLPANPKV